MADDITNPLLSLIKEQSLIDDLQYEEVLGEFKRTGKPVSQILQDFGVMDLDTILQIMADHLGTSVVKLSDLSPDVVNLISGKSARLYQCVPVSLSNGTLQIALMDPLNPARMDELGYLVKKDLQLVVVDPMQSRRPSRNIIPKARKANPFPNCSKNWVPMRKSPAKLANSRAPTMPP